MGIAQTFSIYTFIFSKIKDNNKEFFTRGYVLNLYAEDELAQRVQMYNAKNVKYIKLYLYRQLRDSSLTANFVWLNSPTDDIGGACSTKGREHEYILDIGGEARRNETSRETET
jgi:hypothetical protein